MSKPVARDPRTVLYVAAENAEEALLVCEEALLVCQSPSCRTRRQLNDLLVRLHRHKMTKMVGWKLTITAEQVDAE